MRFMVIVKATKDSEAGKMPSEELLSANGQLLAAWASAVGRAAEAEQMLNELAGPARLLVETAHGCARIHPLTRIVNDSQRAATH